MEKTRRIIRNTAWVLSARVIDVLSNFFLLAIVARYLGVEAFGSFSIVMAAYWIVFPFLLMGTRILARDIAQDNGKADELVGSALNLVAVSILIALAVILLYWLIGGLQAKDFIVAFIVLLTLFFMALTRTMTTVFLAFERMRYEIIVSICISISSMAFTVAVIYFDLGFSFIFVSMMLANLISMVVSAYLMVNSFGVKPSFSFDKSKIIYLVKESYHLAIYMLILQLYFNSGVFALKFMGTNFDVGIFQAPYRVINRMMIIPLTISISVMPLLSQLAADVDARGELSIKMMSIVKLLVMLCLPITIIILVLSDETVLILFGKEFTASAIAMRIQILALGLFFINTFLETVFISLKRQRFLNIISGLGLITAVVLNVLLIPKYGYVGSSIAVPMSQVVMFVAGALYLSDIMKANLLIKMLLKPFIIAFTIGIIIYSLSWLNSYLLAAAGLTIYFVLIAALKVFSAEEIKRFRMIFGRQRQPLER